MNALDCISRPNKQNTIYYAAAAVLVLNLLDAIFTLGYVQLGAAVEANPIMAIPLAIGPMAFMFAKLGMVSLCVAFLWKLRDKWSAMAGLYGAATAYSLLIIYHISAVPSVTLYLQNR